MKWVVVAGFFVCFATLSRGSVSESTEPSSNVRERKKDRRTECLAGSEWESKCHKCWCSEEGHAECTRMEVCEKGVYEDPIRCKPMTTFKIECNTCSCLENGQVLCTLIGCLSSRSDLPVLPEPSTSNNKGRDCLPGSRWKSKCNECFCTEDGLPACTEMACVGREDEPEVTCAPETSWKYECNRCWCQGGKAACTRIGCNTHIFTDFNPNRAETNSEEPLPDIDLETYSKIYEHRLRKREAICKANAAFKVYCNYCECAFDGLSYSCTNHECMERDVNDDVEVFMESEGADHVERHSVCKPRGIFHIGCNTCHCSADGMDFTCTNKPCPLPKDVEVFHELRDLQPIVP